MLCLVCGQAGWKGRKARMEYKQRLLTKREVEAARRAAIRIQAVFRMRMARQDYLLARSSAILTRGAFKAALKRGGLAAERMAAIMLQVRLATPFPWRVTCGVAWVNEGCTCKSALGIGWTSLALGLAQRANGLPQTVTG